jgi:hypothetical protein
MNANNSPSRTFWPHCHEEHQDAEVMLIRAKSTNFFKLLDSTSGSNLSTCLPGKKLPAPSVWRRKSAKQVANAMLVENVHNFHDTCAPHYVFEIFDDWSREFLSLDESDLSVE